MKKLKNNCGIECAVTEMATDLLKRRIVAKQQYINKLQHRLDILTFLSACSLLIAILG